MALQHLPQHRHSTPVIISCLDPMLGTALVLVAPLLPLQWDMQFAKAAGENLHFINRVCMCANKTDGEGVYISTHAGSA